MKTENMVTYILALDVICILLVQPHLQEMRKAVRFLIPEHVAYSYNLN